ncbi:chemotaxis protein CheB [Polyangium jinanense]|uniref:Protein-glutamate methylesterase/protein-glutamine glutaminase n=1 Tax=Polyangium jinanense TaxID=2829994 RepID=A0A9X4AUQ2_9BACT|nr:chemotaxis protein CheB [Polyangium jinanense]MDC3957942.1 response regulator [Polyangium jinanense]MDC3983495.1 response regulator [Polyangium jinanense]
MARVLIVDDSVVMRDIVRAHLAGLALELEVASNGEDALTRMGTSSQPFDLVITDYAMPNMNGLELARRVKERGGTLAPKVILISANKELRERDLLATGYIDAFFPKPVDGSQLAARVSTILALTIPSAPVVPSSRRVRPVIRVVIADDTEVGRTLLARVLKADPEIDVVGMARDGQGAVDLAVRENPQIILLDAMMPGLDGVAATRRIMALAPTRVVIVSDQQGSRPAAQIFSATEAGALDVIARPSWGDPMGPQAVALRDKIKMLAEIPVVRRWADGPRSVRSRRSSSHRAQNRATVVGICASTGGPAAIAAMLPGLAAATSSVPVLIVQHVLAGFDEALAEWLAEVTQLPVRLATHGMPLRAGVIALAPEGKHLVAQSPLTIGVIEGPPVGNHRPSGTPLFESLARHFGDGALGVMLTGMGNDGVEGLRAIKAAGGSVLVQSPDSCVVSGMPGAAISRGYADAVLSLDELGPEIVERVRAPARSRH